MKAKIVTNWILDAGCGMLDTGCGMRDAGYWMRDAGYELRVGSNPVLTVNI
jgi:hypothetical protein